MLTRQIQKFIRLEAMGGLFLMIMLIVALVISNSPAGNYYHLFVNLPIHLRVGAFTVEKPMILWVNEGLMAVFFMLLALEIKREILEGDLSDISQLSLPFACAVGGILFPALIFVAFNFNHPKGLRGWPIPTTTDIAFVLGVISLLGKRVPNSLKVTLVALSIVDDILAVIIIAAFYTAKLSWVSLTFASLGVTTLLLMNYYNVYRITPYVLVGIFIWACVLRSGVHATLGGVIVGLSIPLQKDQHGVSPLRVVEKALHPWVVFFVLPLFVFVNGGISFVDFSWGRLFSRVPLGVTAGLFIGKSLGVFLCGFLLIKLTRVNLPRNSTWLQLFGIAALTGIGFTMSLFFSALAFSGTFYEDLARKGVLLGSLLSCILGVAAFLVAESRNAYRKELTNNEKQSV